MKFNLHGPTSDIEGGCIEAIPGQYDGQPPIERLLVDHRLDSINNDVLALACTLTFGQYMQGNVSFPKPVSPECAQSIEAFMLPSKVNITTIEEEPFSAPEGNGILFISTSPDARFVTPNYWGIPRSSSIQILDSTEYSGSMISVDTLALASNAAVFCKLGTSPYIELPLLAVALLYTERLGCGTLAYDLSGSEENKRRLQQLFLGCKLQFCSNDEANAIIESRRKMQATHER
ncbi:hypothetical protein [Brevibacterium paucivorans]|uniref:hypothetical protein n=1 Tax=Brevibacterium paucivorans TaxID=170994 RepID=UPI0011AEF2AE|nr:hypothetical protein [Brevibacterium paucivorans]